MQVTGKCVNTIRKESARNKAGSFHKPADNGIMFRSGRQIKRKESKMKHTMKKMAVLVLTASMTAGCAVPVLAADTGNQTVKDGTYTAKIQTAGTMFYISENDAERDSEGIVDRNNGTGILKVKNGKMTAFFRLDGTGLDYLYLDNITDNQVRQADPGVGRNLLIGKNSSLDASKQIGHVDRDGYWFAIPVNQLGTAIPVSTHSKKYASTGKGPVWYKDHSVTVSAPVKNITAEKVTKLGSVTKKKKVQKKQFSVSWKKQAASTGYEIQYATAKNFKSAKKKNVNTSETTSAVIKKLKSGKKYYVRVRAVNKAADVSFEWSAAKSIKVK